MSFCESFEEEESSTRVVDLTTSPRVTDCESGSEETSVERVLEFKSEAEEEEEKMVCEPETSGAVVIANPSRPWKKCLTNAKRGTNIPKRLQFGCDVMYINCFMHVKGMVWDYNEQLFMYKKPNLDDAIIFSIYMHEHRKSDRVTFVMENDVKFRELFHTISMALQIPLQNFVLYEGSTMYTYVSRISGAVSAIVDQKISEHLMMFTELEFSYSIRGGMMREIITPQSRNDCMECAYKSSHGVGMCDKCKAWCGQCWHSPCIGVVKCMALCKKCHLSKCICKKKGKLSEPLLYGPSLNDDGSLNCLDCKSEPCSCEEKCECCNRGFCNVYGRDWRNQNCKCKPHPDDVDSSSDVKDPNDPNNAYSPPRPTNGPRTDVVTNKRVENDQANGPKADALTEKDKRFVSFINEIRKDVDEVASSSSSDSDRRRRKRRKGKKVYVPKKKVSSSSSGSESLSEPISDSPPDKKDDKPDKKLEKAPVDVPLKSILRSQSNHKGNKKVTFDDKVDVKVVSRHINVRLCEFCHLSAPCQCKNPCTRHGIGSCGCYHTHCRICNQPAPCDCDVYCQCHGLGDCERYYQATGRGLNPHCILCGAEDCWCNGNPNTCTKCYLYPCTCPQGPTAPPAPQCTVCYYEPCVCPSAPVGNYCAVCGYDPCACPSAPPLGPCTQCNSDPCVCQRRNMCNYCNRRVCICVPSAPVGCDYCGQDPCVCNSPYCTNCGIDPCVCGAYHLYRDHCYVCGYGPPCMCVFRCDCHQLGDCPDHEFGTQKTKKKKGDDDDDDDDDDDGDGSDPSNAPGKEKKKREELKKDKYPRTEPKMREKPKKKRVRGKITRYEFHKDCEWVRFPYFMTQDDAQWLYETFDVNIAVERGHIHDHPVPAAARFLAQRNLEQRFADENPDFKIVDLFGSARLQSKDKHVTRPIVDVKDLYREYELYSQCPHIKCECAKDATHAMIVDVVYYLKPNEIASYVEQYGSLWSMHFAFDKETGKTMNGQYRWNTYIQNKQPMIHVRVGREGVNIYNHSALTWLRKNVWQIGPNKWLYYNVRGSFGPIEYGQFHVSEYKLNVPQRNHDFDDYYIIDSQKYIKNEKWGPEKWFENFARFVGLKPKYEEIKVMVPRTLFGKLVRCVAFSHTREEREKLIPTLKGKIERWQNVKEDCFKMDDLELANILPHVICAALVYGMPDDFGALNKFYHDDIHKVNPYTYESQYVRLSVSGAAFMATSALIAGVLTMSGVIAGIGGVVAGIAVSAAVMAFNGGDEKDKEQLPPAPWIQTRPMCIAQEVENWNKVLEDIPLATASTQHAIVGFTEPLDGDGRINVHPVEILKQSTMCSDKCMMRHNRQHDVVSMYTYDHCDIYNYSPCNTNAYAALRMRWFRVTPPQDLATWHQILANDGFDRCYRLAFPNDPRMEAVDYEALEKEWMERFPKKEQQRMLESKTSPPSARQLHITSGFVKQEINLKAKTDTPFDHRSKAEKPRYIHVKEAYHKYHTGPSMYQVKKWMMSDWNGQNGIIFGSGYTAADIGDLLVTAMTDRGISFEDCHAHECDLRMCETTMRGYFVNMEFNLYQRMGIERRVLDLLFDKPFIEGRTLRPGLHYKMARCRESGTTNTTVGNSIVYGFSLFMVAKYLNIPENYVVLVGGDDCVVYHPPNQNDLWKRAFDLVALLGLDPEVIHRENALKARFYSGYFVRAVLDQNPQTREITIHIPGIGKAGSKAWSYRVKQGLEPMVWAREVAVQRKIIWNYIPGLRHQAEAVLKYVQPYVKNKKRPLAYYRELDPVRNTWTLPEKNVKYAANENTFVDLANIYDLGVDELKRWDEIQKDRFDRLSEYVGIEWDDTLMRHMFEIDTA